MDFFCVIEMEYMFPVVVIALVKLLSLVPLTRNKVVGIGDL